MPRKRETKTLSDYYRLKRVNDTLQRVWTKALNKPEYVPREWQSLERQIRRLARLALQAEFGDRAVVGDDGDDDDDGDGQG